MAARLFVLMAIVALTSGFFAHAVKCTDSKVAAAKYEKEGTGFNVDTGVMFEMTPAECQGKDIGFHGGKCCNPVGPDLKKDDSLYYCKVSDKTEAQCQKTIQTWTINPVRRETKWKKSTKFMFRQSKMQKH